jgi:uncharacterized protein (AIM24 family)
MVLDLQNEHMTVNSDSILAFEGNVDWDIRRVEGAWPAGCSTSSSKGPAR